MKEIVVALTGASGNMGLETLRQLMELERVKKIKVLLLFQAREKRLARTWQRRYGKRLEVIYGDIAKRADCDRFISGSDYVLNLAAVIPPLADHSFEAAKSCNLTGAENLADAVAAIKCNQPKLVHISSVAIYGNRNYLHPWGRVGDPLISSTYDAYSATKICAERYVIESDVKSWVVLRQTGILHSRMLKNNMKDGLMFHTCFNAPIEWVTARDNGLLMKNLVESDASGQLEEAFWKKCYNIGGGASNRCTGYDTFDAGFKIIGGSTEKFMKPSWNSLRNFHCLWFYDSDILNDYFHYQTQDVNDYWQEIIDTHRYYKLAKFMPSKLISKFAIERLLGDDNAPKNWIKTRQKGKVKAFFGSDENLDCMPDDWRYFPVLAKGQLADGDVDYDDMRDWKKVKEHGYLLSHGYDESKPDCELDIEDMRSAAAFRGGKCLSENMTKGELYAKLEWECHDGHRFFASPYLVLKAGHWCAECCQPEPWDYDRLSKFMPFYAQVWYDTHAKAENRRYFFDSKHNAKFVRYETKDIRI